MRINLRKSVYKRYKREAKNNDRYGWPGYSKHIKKRSKNEIESKIKWATGGIYHFPNQACLLKFAIETNIKSNNKIVCEGCGSDLWAIVPQSILFWTSKLVYCQECGKPLEIKGVPGYISQNDFNKVLEQLNSE